jgi:16S rRNA (cytosine1402-N4)-methyltransferase
MIDSDDTSLLYQHTSVLATELLTAVALHPAGYYLDATFGGGGHSRLLLETTIDTRVLGVDRDGEALRVGESLQARYGDRLSLLQSNFATLKFPPAQFDGIIADLGVSSPQLDRAERGFSFRVEAPLDMRMDQNQSLTAATIINQWEQNRLATLFYEYGEERLSRQIARAIIQKRPIATTTDLAAVISGAVPPSYRYGRIHPATRVFQALRIAVNDELSSLEQFLEKAPQWLKPGGIIGIISFHSLEDRRVKHSFRDCPILEVITKKPLIPSPAEEKDNPRSRSAKLRLARRI